MALITLTHTSINSGNAVVILASSVKYTGKRNNKNDPNPNTAKADVMTVSTENPIIVLSNIYITGDADVLTFSDIKVLYKLKNTGSNRATLNIIYDEAEQLLGLDDEVEIPVVLDTFVLTLSAKDSKNAYLPSLTITFTEDA